MNFSNFVEQKSAEKKTKALEVIIKGSNLDRKNDFWDDFLYLCGNAEGFAEILNVPKEKITGVHKRIKELKNDLEDEKEVKFKDRLLKTGDKVEHVAFEAAGQPNLASFRNVMGTSVKIDNRIKADLRAKILQIIKEYSNMDPTLLYKNIIAIVGSLLTKTSGTNIQTSKLYKNIYNSNKEQQNEIN